MLRLLLTILGAAMLVLYGSNYLSEKIEGETISSLPLGIAFATLVAICLLPKRKTRPLFEAFEEACTVATKVAAWFGLLELGILAGLVAVVVILIATLPKAFIVFFAWVAGVAFVGFLLVLMIEDKRPNN